MYSSNCSDDGVPTKTGVNIVSRASRTGRKPLPFNSPRSGSLILKPSIYTSTLLLNEPEIVGAKVTSIEIESFGFKICPGVNGVIILCPKIVEEGSASLISLIIASTVSLFLRVIVPGDFVEIRLKPQSSESIERFGRRPSPNNSVRGAPHSSKPS